MPDLAVTRPLGEDDLADQLGLHPGRVLAEPPRRTRREGALAYLERIETRAQLPRDPDGEPGADLSGKDQRSFIVGADEQRADPLPRALGIREAADHEFLAQAALRLHPAGPLATLVRLRPLLGDDALEPHAARFAKSRRPVAVEMGGELQPRTAQDAPQRALAHLQRLAGQ